MSKAGRTHRTDVPKTEQTDGFAHTGLQNLVETGNQ